MAVLLVRVVRARRSSPDARSAAAVPAAKVEDPDELERAADAAERAGRLDDAVRLRFRAGLLRLGSRGAIRYRPSVTTGEVRRVLGSDTFDELARTFEAVAYGGQSRDQSRRRRRAPRMATRRVDGRAAGRCRMTPASSATRTRSPSGRRAGLVVAVIVGALLVLNLLANGVDHAVGGHEPSGVPGSSYGTQDTGLAGLTELLARYGHPVRRVRGALTNVTLDPAATVFVIEPATLTASDTAELLRFVAAGGRLVVGGSDPFYVRSLRDRPPHWTPDGSGAYPEIAPVLGNVRLVESAGDGSWDDPGSGRVVAHDGPTTLATSEHVGLGDIFFLADASPLENAHLAPRRQRGVRARARRRRLAARPVRRGCARLR